MDPREIVQIITDALRRRGYEADVRNLTMSVQEDHLLMRSLGGRRSDFVDLARGPSQNYELAIDLIIDRRSVEATHAREEWERRENRNYMVGQIDAMANPAVRVGALAHSEIENYFANGVVPAARAPVDVAAFCGMMTLVRECYARSEAARPRVAFVDVWAFLGLFALYDEEADGAGTRFALLELD